MEWFHINPAALVRGEPRRAAPWRAEGPVLLIGGGGGLGTRLAVRA